MTNSHIGIILTCTVFVNDRKIWLSQREPLERKRIYLESIRKWLEETDLNIIVVENSGYDFPELNPYLVTYKDRFEKICFQENLVEDELFDRLDARALRNPDDYLYTSKGTSEIFAIYYGSLRSRLFPQCHFVIKITGRYFIPEFEAFLKTKNLHHFDALTSHDPTMCMIVGASRENFRLIFYPDQFKSREGLHIHHIETLFYDRIQRFDETRIVRCPIFNIPPTLNGNNVLIEEL